MLGKRKSVILGERNAQHHAPSVRGERICKICVLAENHLHGFTCSVFAVRRLWVGFMDFSAKHPCGVGDDCGCVLLSFPRVYAVFSYTEAAFYAIV